MVSINNVAFSTGELRLIDVACLGLRFVSICDLQQILGKKKLKISFSTAFIEWGRNSLY